MPTYNYICDNCANLTEVTHGMDEKLEQCPHCETEKQMRKMPSTVTLMRHKEVQKQLSGTTEKPGEVVKESIKEIKGDVEAEREALKKRTFANILKK